jgi:hypothetical protein
MSTCVSAWHNGSVVGSVDGAGGYTSMSNTRSVGGATGSVVGICVTWHVGRNGGNSSVSSSRSVGRAIGSVVGRGVTRHVGAAIACLGGSWWCIIGEECVCVM